MKHLLVNLARCNGCHNCQIACKDEHCMQDWSPIAKPQLMTGQFWCKVNERERGRVPVVRVDYTPTFCGMCDHAACMEKAGDAVYRREDGIVVIDPEKAKGCRELVDACPLGMIYYNEELDLPQKCTGCAHLLDNGWEVPRCVDACATGALTVVDSTEELPAEAVPADELAGMGSHVFYINRVGRFVAGTVADREHDEVIIGAVVRLVSLTGSVLDEQKTDEFGDFRFKDVPVDAVRVQVEAEGYSPALLASDETRDDVVFEDLFVTAERAVAPAETTRRKSK